MNKVFLPLPLQIWFETRRNNYDVLTSAVKVSNQHVLPKQCTQFPQLLTEQSKFLLFGFLDFYSSAFVCSAVWMAGHIPHQHGAQLLASLQGRNFQQFPVVCFFKVYNHCSLVTCLSSVRFRGFFPSLIPKFTFVFLFFFIPIFY